MAVARSDIHSIRSAAEVQKCSAIRMAVRRATRSYNQPSMIADACSRTAVATVLGAALALSSYAAPQSDLERLRDVELQIAKLRLFVPEANDAAPAEIEQSIRTKARAAGIDTISVTRNSETERVLLENAQPSPVVLYRLDISGRDRYAHVQTLLRSIALVPRLVDFETVHLQAASDDTVTFDVRLSLACWSELAHSAPSSPPHDPNALVRTKVAEMESVHRVLTGMKERLKPMRLVTAIAALDAETTGEAIALTDVRLHGDATLNGVTLGASARSGLRKALEKAGFTGSHVETKTLGDCQAFTVTSKLNASDDAPGEVLFNGLFDGRVNEVCATEKSTSTHVTVSGPTDPSALTIHLRDADVADVFRVLNGVSGEDYIVDGDVNGRVTIDAEGSTVANAVAAMRSAGVTAGPGPLHRVSRPSASAGVALRETPYQGEKLGFSIKDADLAELLCIFSDITALKFFLPRGRRPGVSLFVDDIEWDRVLDTLVWSSSLTYTIEKDHVNLQRAGSTSEVAEACEASTYRRPWWMIKPQNLALDDLKLTGIAGKPGAWKAYAYAPGARRLLVLLDAGVKLSGATVRHVDADRVTFATESGGNVAIPLRP